MLESSASWCFCWTSALTTALIICLSGLGCQVQPSALFYLYFYLLLNCTSFFYTFSFRCLSQSTEAFCCLLICWVSLRIFGAFFNSIYSEFFHILWMKMCFFSSNLVVPTVGLSQGYVHDEYSIFVIHAAAGLQKS